MAKAKAKTPVSTSRARKSPSKPKKVAPSKKITKKAPQPKKTITKSTATVRKTATKKTAVKPKRNAVVRKGAKTLELCLILDCTGSMYSWI